MEFEKQEKQTTTTDDRPLGAPMGGAKRLTQSLASGDMEEAAIVASSAVASSHHYCTRLTACSSDATLAKLEL